MTLARVRVAAIVSVLAVVALVVVAYWSPWLKVRAIQVSGDAPALHERIEASLSEFVDRPLHTVDADAVGEVIARDYPSVREVRTARDWPNTLRVELEVRTPVLLLSTPQGTSAWVDASGAVFPTGPAVPGLPILRLGESISSEQRSAAIADAARVHRGAPKEAIERLVRIEVVSRDDIRLVLTDDALVRWGSAEDGRRKAQVLDALLGRNAAVYDVSAPDLPTTKDA